jgi:hypothetical protein
MTNFKAGDIVKPVDGSGVMGMSSSGHLDNTVHGIHINTREFEVIAAECELPIKVCSGLSLSHYGKNDLILRALDNNQVIFITSKQVKLAHRCKCCPNCGERI